MIFSFIRADSIDLEVDLEVSFVVSGTAVYSIDYTVSGASTFNATSGSIIILANNIQADLVMTPIADSDLESDESVTITLLPNPTHFLLGSSSSATGLILNDDIPPPQISLELAPNNSGWNIILSAPVTSFSLSVFYTIQVVLEDGSSTIESYNLNLLTNEQTAFVALGPDLGVRTEILSLIASPGNYFLDYPSSLAIGIFEFFQANTFLAPNTNYMGANSFLAPNGVNLLGANTYLAIQLYSASTRTLTYSNDNDENGLVYFLGTNFATTTFTNPAQSQSQLRALASSIQSLSVNELTDRTLNDVYTADASDQWFVWDLKLRRSLQVERYTLQNRPVTTDNLRSWVLEGTNTINDFTVAGLNSSVWTAIDTRNSDPTINQSGAYYTFICNGSTDSFRYLRLRQTGLNTNLRGYLCLSGIEFYGLFTY